MGRWFPCSCQEASCVSKSATYSQRLKNLHASSSHCGRSTRHPWEHGLGSYIPPHIWNKDIIQHLECRGIVKGAEVTLLHFEDIGGMSGMVTIQAAGFPEARLGDPHWWFEVL